MSNLVGRILHSVRKPGHISSTFRLGILRRQLVHARSPSTMSGTPVTAGIVIIGDEIVKGQVQDCNTSYMCQRLYQKGVQVKTIVTIPDDLGMIAQYVTEFSDKFTYVITAGGIGPTHDDITYEAVAHAFGNLLKVDADLEALYKGYFKERYTDAHRKLATIPESATLFGNGGKFPVVNLRNIFILPGVPKFLKLAFTAVENAVANTAAASSIRTLYLTVDEMSIATELTHVHQQFPDVTIGSYPEWSNNYYRVRIVLESGEVSRLDLCEAELCKRLPVDALIDYNDEPLAALDLGIERMRVGDLEAPLTEALSVCTEALKRYKLDEICIAFNGGKDCTALLHIWFAVASQHPGYQDSQVLQTLYIRNTETFPEEEMFIEQCTTSYKLAMMRYHGPFKEQLAQMKVQHPYIKAVLMGTRSTDPHGDKLSTFLPTDPGWPELMRIHPILSFSYSNVWALLRGLSLPYCRLYDLGYTSLGSAQTTQRNPALKYTDADGVERYRPAYTLTDHQLERSGRR